MSRPEYRMSALMRPGNWLTVALTVTLLVSAAIMSFAIPAAAQQTSPPTLSASSRLAGRVDLSWTEVSGTRYVIARYDRTARRWETIESSYSGLSRTDSSVQAGRSYTYQISADGRNTWSNQEGVFMGFYDAPTLNEPTASDLPPMFVPPVMIVRKAPDQGRQA